MTPFPFWAKHAVIGAAVVIVAGWIGSLYVQTALLRADLADEKADRAGAVADAASAARAELQRQIVEKDRQAAARQEALDAERDLSAAARTDADALRGDVVQLRADARRFAAIRCTARPNSADAGSSAPAPGATDLLADVLGGLAADGAALAAEADRRGIAGSTCQRERDALTTVE